MKKKPAHKISPIPQQQKMLMILDLMKNVNLSKAINWNRLYAESYTWSWVGLKPLGVGVEDTKVDSRKTGVKEKGR
jgi:hypothetical protein